jgi:putative endonuclease
MAANRHPDHHHCVDASRPSEAALPRAHCVYMMASTRNGTVYTGVTSNLAQRVHQHREGLTPSFTRRYHCHLLVFYEYYERMDDAIARE